MRYEKGHKDATRERIIEVASRQFRENGVAAVGLAGIMSDAGLTNGAFYTHFESKEDLVQAVVANGASYRLVFVFLLVIGVLVFKPSGLLGRAAIEKV